MTVYNCTKCRSLSVFSACRWVFSKTNFSSYCFMIYLVTCKLRSLKTLHHFRFFSHFTAFSTCQYSIPFIKMICLIAIVSHFFIVFNKNEITILACNWICAFTFHLARLHENWFSLCVRKLSNYEYKSIMGIDLYLISGIFNTQNLSKMYYIIAWQDSMGFSLIKITVNGLIAWL